VDNLVEETSVHEFSRHLTHQSFLFYLLVLGKVRGSRTMIVELIQSFYPWIKAVHVMAVIAWMAGLFYLPRLFVYHAEKASVGSELDTTFTIMERKLLRVIMTPSMLVAWGAGLLMIAGGGLDFGAVWGWAKLLSVVAMTVFHFWLAGRCRDFAGGTNAWSGRSYRMMNEVPTILMLVIVVAVIVRPF
jgi:putative membrane protein